MNHSDIVFLSCFAVTNKSVTAKHQSWKFSLLFKFFASFFTRSEERKALLQLWTWPHKCIPLWCACSPFSYHGCYCSYDILTAISCGFYYDLPATLTMCNHNNHFWETFTHKTCKADASHALTAQLNLLIQCKNTFLTHCVAIKHKT